MARNGVQVLGLCRFSYPSAPGAFGTIPGEDLESTRAQLYDPERLGQRLFMFTHIVLPALRQQTDPDFTLLVMIGDQMPSDMRRTLDDAVADIPQVRIVAWPEGIQHRVACREVMLAHRDPDAETIAEFRLDDDDAVSLDFVAEVRRIYEAGKGLFATERTLALDFNKGFALHIGEGPARPVALTARYWAPGLVIFVKPFVQRSLLDFPHMRVWRRMPTITHGHEFMFLRGVHDLNDSNVAKRYHMAEELTMPDNPSGIILTRFGVDIQALS